jgi:hypothetical protein
LGFEREIGFVRVGSWMPDGLVGLQFTNPTYGLAAFKISNAHSTAWEGYRTGRAKRGIPTRNVSEGAAAKIQISSTKLQTKKQIPNAKRWFGNCFL